MISGVMAGVGGLVRPAWATPRARALTLRQLVDGAGLVVQAVTTPRESAWVDVFGARRIVTFWRLEQTGAIEGRAAGDQEVVTLGGTVSNQQQWVPEEAALRARRPHLLFLRQGPFERWWVTGLLQGAFELATEGGELRVGLSPEQAQFLDTAGSAIARLSGLTVDAAAAAIREERES